jgi:hypothetical protein
VQHAGFVFENSVLKAILDARPNPMLKLNKLEEQLRSIQGAMDHMQTNLSQISMSVELGSHETACKGGQGQGCCGD